MDLKRIDGLEINEDLTFQRRMWVVERVGWCAMALVCASAAGSPAVLRAAVVYFVLLLLVRLTGRRTLGQMTPFDLVLLLILSETVQGSLVGEDTSMANGLLLATTLLLIDVGMSLLKRASPHADRWIDGTPLVLVRDGRLDRGLLHRSRIDEADILAAARTAHGLERLDQIKHAVLESNGTISIVPRA